MRKEIYTRGTRIIEIDTYDIRTALNIDYFDIDNNVISEISKDDDICYVSSGFAHAIDLLNDANGDAEQAGIENCEFHHYFVKDDVGNFEACKFHFGRYFNIK